MSFRPIGDFMVIEIWKDAGSKIALPDYIPPKESDKFIVKAVGQGILLQDGTYIKHDIKPGDIICMVGKVVKSPGGTLFARMQDVVGVERVEIPSKI